MTIHLLIIGQLTRIEYSPNRVNGDANVISLTFNYEFRRVRHGFAKQSFEALLLLLGQAGDTTCHLAEQAARIATAIPLLNKVERHLATDLTPSWPSPGRK
jgi:hypothetical protein